VEGIDISPLSLRLLFRFSGLFDGFLTGLGEFEASDVKDSERAGEGGREDEGGLSTTKKSEGGGLVPGLGDLKATEPISVLLRLMLVSLRRCDS
jgi:hypothetical protein